MFSVTVLLMLIFKSQHIKCTLATSQSYDIWIHTAVVFMGTESFIICPIGTTILYLVFRLSMELQLNFG